MRIRSLVGFTFILMASVAGTAADEWRAEKLRGLVFVHHEGQWIPLERGDIVADDRVIRTLPSGRVEFVRDEERIQLGGDSQIQIRDAERARFTSVEQWYGKVTIEAEKQNIEHFSVQTPFLAAVVKGTRFTVTSRDGKSRVNVEEGTVQVRDELYDVVTDVIAGQRADVSQGQMLEVAGRGPKAPVITIGTGQVVTQAVRDAIEDGEILPGEVGRAVANVAAGLNPGNGLGRANGNAGGNGSGSQGSGNSANGSGSNGVGPNVGVGVGNAGSAGGNAAGGVSGVGVDVNAGGGGASAGVGGGSSGNAGSGSSNSGHGGASSGKGNSDRASVLDIDVDLGGIVGSLLGG